MSSYAVPGTGIIIIGLPTKPPLVGPGPARGPWYGMPMPGGACGSIGFGYATSGTGAGAPGLGMAWGGTKPGGGIGIMPGGSIANHGTPAPAAATVPGQGQPIGTPACRNGAGPACGMPVGEIPPASYAHPCHVPSSSGSEACRLSWCCSPCEPSVALALAGCRSSPAAPPCSVPSICPTPRPPAVCGEPAPSVKPGVYPATGEFAWKCAG
mmetsp:Transcript_50568/g.100952  ORF Transcript_50568/g.100952 Transcript_50568/m.100952 type:complete len:211 (+) Transcript_50568:500-1132(+)